MLIFMTLWPIELTIFRNVIISWMYLNCQFEINDGWTMSNLQIALLLYDDSRDCIMGNQWMLLLLSHYKNCQINWSNEFNTEQFRDQIANDNCTCISVNENTRKSFERRPAIIFKDWRLIINWTIRNKCQWNAKYNDFHSRKSIQKCCLQYIGLFLGTSTC